MCFYYLLSLTKSKYHKSNSGLSFNCQGRGFNVQIHYLEEPVSDYLQAVVSTVLSIHDQVASRLQ